MSAQPAMRGRHALHVAISSIVAACTTGAPATQKEPPEVRPAPAAAIAAEETAVAPAPVPSITAALHGPGARITFPAGSFLAGSRTGSRWRDPSREVDGLPVELPEFEMDVRPYPNTPADPPRTNVSREEASALCAERDLRLCSELEWERACKGGGPGEYPWRAPETAESCQGDPGQCVTEDGVVGLGLLGREWTSSVAQAGIGDAMRSVAVRGAPREAGARAHRCSGRDAATPDSRSEALTFRCCKGPESTERYPDEPGIAPVDTHTVDEDALRELLASMPGTAPLANSFRAFSEADIERALAATRTVHVSLAPWQPLIGLVHWAPVPREHVVVVAGDATEGAAVVAYYPDVGGAPQLIATYETRGEHAPIILAVRSQAPKELVFTSCWGCEGEGGSLTLNADGLVHLTPH
jgi:formylglycine-generating enzyme required for sulfatase activity